MATFWRGCETTKQQACGREIRHTACDLGYQHKTWMSFFLKTFCGSSGTKKDLRSEFLHFKNSSPLRFSRTFIDNSPCLWVKNGENQTPDGSDGSWGHLRLEQLTNMGFPDRPSNIQALQMANGDVNQVPISPISSRVWGRWEEMEGDGRNKNLMQRNTWRWLNKMSVVGFSFSFDLRRLPGEVQSSWKCIVVNGLRWRHPAWLVSRMEGHGGRPSHFICLTNNQPQRLTIRIWTSNFWIRNYRVESASPK